MSSRDLPPKREPLSARRLSLPVNKKEIAKKLSKRTQRTDDPNNPLRHLSWEKHRLRVASARPFVDSKSPLVPTNMYSSPAKFNRSIGCFVRIERENAQMLERIAHIMKSPSTVDCHIDPPMLVPNVHCTREYKAREMALLKIAFENMDLHDRIKAVKATYDRKKQIADYKVQEEHMELACYYPLFWRVPENTPYEKNREKAMKSALRNPKPRVFLNLETEEAVLGQVVIELRADVVPLTAYNFRCLCTGERGLSYKCSQIHRVVPEIMWVGGNVVGKDGRGGKSIYGDAFPDENFKLKHKEAGTVSMFNCGKDSNGSQFIITASPLAALDGTNVVVGKVVSGLEILHDLSKLVTATGALRKKIWIASCGSTDVQDSPSTQNQAALQGNEAETEDDEEAEE